MDEKNPRRMPILITAERLDYKESVARTENKRVGNRLELNKGTLSDHENTNLSSMNYEMRRLKHELKGIRQTSGYLIVNKQTSNEGLQKEKIGVKSRRRHQPRVAKRKHRSTQATAGYMPRVEEKSALNNKDVVKTEKLSALPNISRNATEAQVLGSAQDSSKLSNALNIPDSSYVNKTLDTAATKYNHITSLTSAAYDKNPSAPLEMTFSAKNSEENGSKPHERLMRPSSKEMTKTDTIPSLDVDAARGRIHNRLTGNFDNSDQTTDDSDLSPYMHVPPDGLPRTVYLLPPLKDLFSEAKKARYIRKLRKPHMVLDEDDPERELHIDEIFRKT